MSEQTDTVTITEFMELSKIKASRLTIIRMIKRGELKGGVFAGRYQIPRAEIKRAREELGLK